MNAIKFTIFPKKCYICQKHLIGFYRYGNYVWLDGLGGHCKKVNYCKRCWNKEYR